LEQIYAEELMGNCLYAVGKVDEAKELFTEALCGIETEIDEAECLMDGIKKNLEELTA